MVKALTLQTPNFQSVATAQRFPQQSPVTVFHLYTILKMMWRVALSLFAVSFFASVSAQFQFFEQMFQGQPQQQQQPQNVASDSNWYQQNYAAGKLLRRLSIARTKMYD